MIGTITVGTLIFVVIKRIIVLYIAYKIITKW